MSQRPHAAIPTTESWRDLVGNADLVDAGIAAQLDALEKRCTPRYGTGNGKSTLLSWLQQCQQRQLIDATQRGSYTQVLGTAYDTYAVELDSLMTAAKVFA